MCLHDTWHVSVYVWVLFHWQWLKLHATKSKCNICGSPSHIKCWSPRLMLKEAKEIWSIPGIPTRTDALRWHQVWKDFALFLAASRRDVRSENEGLPHLPHIRITTTLIWWLPSLRCLYHCHCQLNDSSPVTVETSYSRPGVCPCLMDPQPNPKRQAS